MKKSDRSIEFRLRLSRTTDGKINCAHGVARVLGLDCTRHQQQD
jgi:hypothetical protein